MPKPNRPIFLFAFANDADVRLALVEEERKIRAALQKADSQGVIEYKPIHRATLIDIFNSLNSFHNKIALFHYGGHSDEEAILLEDIPGKGGNLGVLLGQEKNLALVFLNGCSNKAQIQALFEHGVRAVIATRSDIDDGKALIFAEQFYLALAEAKTIRQAFDTAVSYTKSYFPDADITVRGIGALDRSAEFPWGLYANDLSVLSLSIDQLLAGDWQEDKYFKILHILEVQVVDFLKTRSLQENRFSPFYLKRPYLDDKLRYNYEKRRPTIITGKPLAGKTRAVYQFCVEELKNADIRILFPFKKDIDLQDFSLPDFPGKAILFYDDFNHFLDQENLTEVLERALLNPDIWVVATCRKDSLILLEERLTDIYHNFDVVDILNLDEQEKKAFETQSSVRINPKSDGTIGGYILRVNAS